VVKSIYTVFNEKSYPVTTLSVGRDLVQRTRSAQPGIISRVAPCGRVLFEKLI
jgi:hypothetical protein